VVTFEVNLKGMYLVTGAGLLFFRENKDTIVNVTSTGAYRLIEGISAYETGKFALFRFSELLQLENPYLAVLAVDPGKVATDMGLQNPEHVLQCEFSSLEYCSEIILPATL
jgi:NAD(P)-dependent dehydrogenase (short-subunit alcohol dehydrogenase family)